MSDVAKVKTIHDYVVNLETDLGDGQDGIPEAVSILLHGHADAGDRNVEHDLPGCRRSLETEPEFTLGVDLGEIRLAVGILGPLPSLLRRSDEQVLGIQDRRKKHQGDTKNQCVGFHMRSVSIVSQTYEIIRN